MADIDLNRRDPNDLNSHIKVDFEDVLGEPDGAHSFDKKIPSHTDVESKATMDDNINLDKRDPNDLNSHIKVDFEDVLGEPDGAHSFDKVWIFSYKCYRCGLGCCYKLLTLLCGLCIALYWGCTFACLTFEHVWCWTPYMRCFSIFAGACQKFIGILMNCCVAPICETCGLFFSQITVHNK
ncbi:CAV3 [Mytilus coruscus]|uniref:Caveolin n=1 Tax=Mytilus coruscus TaxID=42192 RepID=A0A6J8E0D5_MYTCO|nr:CAV3 [Mytilus coruscus]